MNISEVEKRTDITKKNIRFYEKAGLLSPARNKDNRYRQYTEKDVAALLEIKLFRKLGLPLEDIRALQAGEVTLDASMDEHLRWMDHKIQEMRSAKRICSDIIANRETCDTLAPDKYLACIAEKEQGGERFVDIARDFLKKLQTFLPPKVEFTWYPEDPIMNPQDFTRELCRFAEQEGHKIDILRESMTPVLFIDGEKYRCALRYAGYRSSLGYRFVVMYKVEPDAPPDRAV